MSTGITKNCNGCGCEFQSFRNLKRCGPCSTSKPCPNSECTATNNIASRTCKCGTKLRETKQKKEAEAEEWRKKGEGSKRNSGYAIDKLKNAVAFANGAGYCVFAVAYKDRKHTTRHIVKRGVPETEMWRTTEELILQRIANDAAERTRNTQCISHETTTTAHPIININADLTQPNPIITHLLLATPTTGPNFTLPTLTAPKSATTTTIPKTATTTTVPKPATTTTAPKPTTTTPQPTTTAPKPATNTTITIVPKSATTTTTVPKSATTTTTPKPATTTTVPKPTTTTAPKPATNTTIPKPATTTTAPKPTTIPKPVTTAPKHATTTPKPVTTTTTTTTIPKPATTSDAALVAKPTKQRKRNATTTDKPQKKKAKRKTEDAADPGSAVVTNNKASAGKAKTGRKRKEKNGRGYVESIRNHRVKEGIMEFLVKWIGFPETDNTSEPADVGLGSIRHTPAYKLYAEEKKLDVDDN